MGVYSEIKKLQKSAAEDDYIVFYSYRKISVFFTMFFVKLGVTANFVTVLSVFADLLAIYFMSINMWILAAIFVQVAIILDNSDGEVARYNLARTKNPKETHFGGYLDEVLGVLGFAIVIFFAGYFMGNWPVGLFAMFGLFMIIVSSTTARIEFKNKEKIVKNFEKKLVGNLKGRVGFSNASQRILVTIAVLFSSWIVLLIFGILAHAFWILKFWVYRNQ